MKKVKKHLSGWYWRAVYFGLTTGVLLLAFAAPDEWD